MERKKDFARRGPSGRDDRRGGSDSRSFKPRSEGGARDTAAPRRDYKPRAEGGSPSFERRDSRPADRKPYGDRPARTEHKPFSRPNGEHRAFNRDNNSGDRKPFSRDGRPFERRDDREGSSAPRSFERRDNREGGERKSFGGDRGGYGDRKPFEREAGDRKPFNRDGGERKPYNNDRGGYGDRKPFGGGDRKPYNNDGAASEGRSFERRDNREGGERKSFGGDRGGYGDRKPFEREAGDRKPFNRDGGDRKSFGGGDRKPFGRNDSSRPNKRDDVPSRSSMPDYEANEPEPLKNQDIRLNRYIAMSGVCSRREADELIESGVITVNGEVVTELGAKIKGSDDIRMKGEELRGEKKVYVLINKPKGYVTTLEDPNADRTVMELLKGEIPERIYPVGRLDKNTMGVLLLTNDGELTKQLTHPSYGKKKIYHVFLDKAVTAADLQTIAQGIELEDGLVFADEISYVENNHKEVGLELHSGRNRIVRRIFEHLGYKVSKLDRVYFAGMTKKGLQRGFWRYLTTQEVSMLKSGAYE